MSKKQFFSSPPQALNSGVHVDLFPGQVPKVFLQFPAYVPVSNGQWHHVAVTWRADTGTLTLVSDGLIADKREMYGAGPDAPLPAQFGYVTLVSGFFIIKKIIGFFLKIIESCAAFGTKFVLVHLCFWSKAYVLFYLYFVM